MQLFAEYLLFLEFEIQELLSANNGGDETAADRRAQMEQVTMFIDFATIIPPCDMFDLASSRGHVYCVPNSSCIPYVGLYKDLMEHMKDV